MKAIKGADLFAGGGGTSTGLILAAEELGMKLDLVAVNHWDLAIETHSANHPGVKHYIADLEILEPRKAVPGGKLKILVASPECIHFSNARGGRPMSDQSRSSADYVVRWLTELDVDEFLLENVQEFLTWGPLHKDTQRPIENRKGQFFARFIRQVQALGYTVEWRLMTAANYGDATTRKRLFVRGSKVKRTIKWPEVTHMKEQGMFNEIKPWKNAQEIINWNNLGHSIYSRKKPLVENTMRRIMRGLELYNGVPFMLGQQSGSSPRSINMPVPTIAGAGAISLIHPFIVQMDQTGGNGKSVRSILEPLPTINGKAMLGVVNPFLVEFNGNSSTAPVNIPVRTITGADRFGVAQPIAFEENGKKYIVDIYFRMMEVQELSRAMSFPEGYWFSGTRDDAVKQIGNSVPVLEAKALCKSALIN